MMEIADILKEAGFEVVEGHDAVKQAIEDCASGSKERLCSGWRVFPGGDKCPGCSDCGR